MKNAVALLVEKKLEQFQDPTDLKIYKDEILRLQKEVEDIRAAQAPQLAELQAEIMKREQIFQSFQIDSQKRLEEMRHAFHEFEAVRKEYLRLQEENLHLKEYAQEETEHHEALVNELRKAAEQQKIALEKKQRYIAKLEGKVRDLMYEIRSLLQLEMPLEESEIEAVEEPKPLSSLSLSHPFDLSSQLQRYVDMAQSLTGLSYAEGKPSRFMDLTPHTFAIDQRRLFDSLNDETAGILFLFSQVEMKFVFVSKGVKTFLGWSPEKFMKEFPHLVLEGYSEWREALGKIHGVKEAKLDLNIQSRSGSTHNFECMMKMLTSGPFTLHILGILVP